MDQQNPNFSIKAADRKTVEKNRRDQMKVLCSRLSSLVPDMQEVVSMHDQLEGATNYIRKLRADLEKMRKKKSHLLATDSGGRSSSTAGIRLPSIEISVVDSVAEMVLITGLNSHQLVFMESLRMLHEEEGAQVISASYSLLDRLVFHTVHFKIADSGEDRHELAARISERLKKFVYGIS